MKVFKALDILHQSSLELRNCQKNEKKKRHYSKSSTSSSPVLPKFNFRFLPGISFFPSPNPTPAFFLNTSKSCSASSAHSKTRCRPRRCVWRNAAYAFSASWRDINSRNAKPRDRELNFLGRRTDLSWPWEL